MTILDGCEPFHTFAQNIDWWYMLESVNHNLSLVLRKLVFGVPDRVLYKPGWIITEDENLGFRKKSHCNIYAAKTKALIRFS